MATYSDAGVDIEKGDEASNLAYLAAKNTFEGRSGMIGEPLVLEGGFTGLMDFGDFYLTQNDDGVGTKSKVAGAFSKYDSLGYDLLAMVVDDLVCIGAEAVSVSNTIDISTVERDVVAELMKGLEAACKEQKVVIPGGEIAELSDMVDGLIWNATAVGILEKDKFIDGKKVVAGDKLIGLKSNGFRSNGMTLVRYILDSKYGPDWVNEEFEGKKWGEIVLKPSKIYHRDVLSIIGGYKEERKIDIHGIVHVTGGGIPGNVERILKVNGLGARLDNLMKPHPEMVKLQEFGDVSDKEAYRTWNMGVGMVLVVAEDDVEKVEQMLSDRGVENQVIGEVVGDTGVDLGV